MAGLLREHTPDDAVLCRAGGEEFLVALTSVTSDVRPLITQFCTALDGIFPRITASIGTASAELHLLTGPSTACPVDELILIAGGAMYAAKRRGGNQVHHGVRAEPIATRGAPPPKGHGTGAYTLFTDSA